MKTNKIFYCLSLCCVLFVVFAQMPVTAQIPSIESMTPNPAWIPTDGNYCDVTVTLANA